MPSSTSSFGPKQRIGCLIFSKLFYRIWVCIIIYTITVISYIYIIIIMYYVTTLLVIDVVCVNFILSRIIGLGWLLNIMCCPMCIFVSRIFTSSFTRFTHSIRFVYCLMLTPDKLTFTTADGFLHWLICQQFISHLPLLLLPLLLLSLLLLLFLFLLILIVIIIIVVVRRWVYVAPTSILCLSALLTTIIIQLL